MPQERRSRSPRDDRRSDSRGRRERYDRYDDRREGHREHNRNDRRASRKKQVGASFAMLYAVGVIGVSILLACVGWAMANDVLALNKKPKTVTITITAEDSFGDVAKRLDKEGLIQYRTLFKLFATITHSKDKVTMGTYTLNTDMDYRALIAGMSVNSATKAEVSVVIPEGYSTQQIFELLEEKGVATAEDLKKEAAEHDYQFSFLKDLPLGDAGRLEGYLYPDTYTFYTPHSPLYAINKLLVNFDSRITDELREEITNSGKTMHEVLTVASLIEKETDGTDRALIASVIYNRLNNPKAGTAGYLQIDATLAYLNGGKVPTEADKAIDSPYNTYKYKGLPPGPICNPGMDSIRAAMHPEKSNYYYYALGDDKVHHFFKTYEEHQKFIASQELYKK